LVPGENYLIFSYEFNGPKLAGVKINGSSKLSKNFYPLIAVGNIELSGSVILRISYNDRVCDLGAELPCMVFSPTRYQECISSIYYMARPAFGQAVVGVAKLPAITHCRQSFFVPTENITTPPN
jgi:hypothetical protein